MNYEEELLSNIDNIVETLQDVAYTTRQLRQEIHIYKRDIKNFKSKITKLEKELSVYKEFVKNHEQTST